MAFTYVTNYRIYLTSIALAAFFLVGWLDWFFSFSLESFPLASFRNIVAIGLFYVAIQAHKNQVDW